MKHFGQFLVEHQVTK